MRIGIFTNTYEPLTNGVTVSINGFKKGLEAQHHEVFIFAPHFSGHTDTNHHVYRYPSLNLTRKIKFPLAIVFSPRIRSIVRELHLDIIHSQHPYIIGKAALRYARELRIPIIFTNHTRYESYVHYIPIIPDPLLHAIAIGTSTRYANQCNAVIAPSGSIKNILIRNGVKAPIEVLPSGIDLAPFQLLDRVKIRHAIRARHRLTSQDTVLLYVGRISAEKNIDFLVRVFQRIHALKKNTYFMIVGDGPAIHGLQKFAATLGIQDKIIFTGLIAHQDIPRYYAAADIFIHSSLSETQGLILVEAMASGLPIVAVAATGASDIIIQGITGILTPYSIEDFFQATLQLIHDQEYRLLLGRQGTLEARQYSIDHSTTKLLELYQRIRHT